MALENFFMHNLDQKVFGKITTKEIIGAEPSIQKIKLILENELHSLLSKLDIQSQENLKNLLDEQKKAEEHVNCRPGAMALAQNKIQLFNEFSTRYILEIKKLLEP
jgi:hypothetical protein